MKKYYKNMSLEACRESYFMSAMFFEDRCWRICFQKQSKFAFVAMCTVESFTVWLTNTNGNLVT